MAMFWWAAAALAVLAVAVIVRDLTRGSRLDEPATDDPVRELRYGHHAREALGWGIQPPGGNSG